MKKSDLIAHIEAELKRVEKERLMGFQKSEIKLPVLSVDEAAELLESLACCWTSGNQGMSYY